MLLITSHWNDLYNFNVSTCSTRFHHHKIKKTGGSITISWQNLAVQTYGPWPWRCMDQVQSHRLWVAQRISMTPLWRVYLLQSWIQMRFMDHLWIIWACPTRKNRCHFHNLSQRCPHIHRCGGVPQARTSGWWFGSCSDTGSENLTAADHDQQFSLHMLKRS